MRLLNPVKRLYAKHKLNHIKELTPRNLALLAEIKVSGGSLGYVTAKDKDTVIVNTRYINADSMLENIKSILDAMVNKGYVVMSQTEEQEAKSLADFLTSNSGYNMPLEQTLEEIDAYLKLVSTELQSTRTLDEQSAPYYEGRLAGLLEELVQIKLLVNQIGA